MNVNTYNYNEEEEKYLGISLVYILVQFKAWSSAAIIYIEKKKIKSLISGMKNSECFGF